MDRVPQIACALVDARSTSISAKDFIATRRNFAAAWLIACRFFATGCIAHGLIAACKIAGVLQS